MSITNLASDMDSFEPNNLIGNIINFDGCDYELVSVFGMGMEKIVYELRNLETKEITHVARIYRRKLTQEEILRIKDTYSKFKNAELPVPETSFLVTGGWLIEIQPHLAPPGSGNVLIDVHSMTAINMEHMAVQAVDELVRVGALYQSRDFEEALKECNIKLEDFPLNPDYMALKGGCLLALGKLEDAREILQLCIEVEPNEARHYLNLAMAEFAAGQPGYARALTMTGVAKAPSNLEAIKRMVTVELDFGNLKEASIGLERLSKLSPTDTDLELLRNKLTSRTKQVAMFDKNIAAGWDEYKNGNYEKAKQIAGQIQQQEPYYIRAWMLLGAIAQKSQDWTNAILNFGHALSLNIADPEITFNLGRSYLELGDLKLGTPPLLIWVKDFADEVNEISHLNNLKPGEHGANLLVNNPDQVKLLKNRDRILSQFVTILDLVSQNDGTSTPEVSQLETYIKETRTFLENVQLTRVNELLITWIFQPDWPSSQNYLTENALLLLTGEAQQTLELIQQRSPQRPFVQHLVLLRYCREKGIQRAYLPFLSTNVASDIGSILDWINTPDWDTSKAYLCDHSIELMTDMAEMELDMLALENQEEKAFEQHLSLLRQCRTIGIEKAYFRFTPAVQQYQDRLIEWMKTSDWSSSENYLRAEAGLLLTDEAEIAMQVLKNLNPDDVDISEHLSLLGYCRTDGIENAYYAQHMRKPVKFSQMANLLIKWLKSENWSTSAAYLRDHQTILLTPYAEEVLQQLQFQNQNNAVFISRHIDLLKLSKSVGIEAAFKSLIEDEL